MLRSQASNVGLESVTGEKGERTYQRAIANIIAHLLEESVSDGDNPFVSLLKGIVYSDRSREGHCGIQSRNNTDVRSRSQSSYVTRLIITYMSRRQKTVSRTFENVSQLKTKEDSRFGTVSETQCVGPSVSDLALRGMVRPTQP